MHVAAFPHRGGAAANATPTHAARLRRQCPHVSAAATAGKPEGKDPLLRKNWAPAQVEELAVKPCRHAFF